MNKLNIEPTAKKLVIRELENEEIKERNQADRRVLNGAITKNRFNCAAKRQKFC